MEYHEPFFWVELAAMKFDAIGGQLINKFVKFLPESDQYLNYHNRHNYT